MSSLLSPFNFGHRTVYFAVEVTIHQLQDVPLVSGRFQAKWKVKNPHHYSAHLSYGGANGGDSTPHTPSHLAKFLPKESTEDEDQDQDEVPDDDAQSSRSYKDDAKSSISSHPGHEDRLAIPSPSSFLSNIFHRRHRKDSSGHPGLTRSAGPSRARSFESRSIDSPRKSSATERSRESKQSQQLSDFAMSSTHPTNFHAEPRGASEWVELDDHKVVWSRTFQSGIRVSVDKAKVGGQHPPSSSVDSAYDSRGLRSRSSHRDLRLQEDKDNQDTTGWGSLAHSELKITIRQDVETDSHSSGSAALGVVVINLAEYAPCPMSHQHHHHHGHHHHHHHHHHNHHNHHHQNQQMQQQPQSSRQTATGSAHTNPPPTPLPFLQRMETRRYLLQESKTNASLQISVKVTHIGGSREYIVPPIRRGLIIGGLRSDSDVQERPGSEKSSLHEALALKRQPSSTSMRHFSNRRRVKQSSHLDKFAASNNSTRIPAKSLKGGSELKKSGWSSNHSSSVNPVSSWNVQSVSGKGRQNAKLQSFAFGCSGAGSWEREPSEVIDSIWTAADKSRTRSEASKGGKLANPQPDPMRPSSSQRSVNSGASSDKEKMPLAARRQSGSSGIRPLLTCSRTSSPCVTIAQLSPIKKIRPLTAGSSAASSPSARYPTSVPGTAGGSGTATPDRSNARIKWEVDGTDKMASPSTGLLGNSDSSRPADLQRGISDDAIASRGSLQRSVSFSTSASGPSSPILRKSALSQETTAANTSSTPSDALSPSASTVMPDDATPMPSRITSVALARHHHPIAVQSAFDSASETGDTVTGRVRKKKSKGLIGIRPSEAQRMGLKGAGWRGSELRSGFTTFTTGAMSASSSTLQEGDDSPKGSRGHEDNLTLTEHYIKDPPSINEYAIDDDSSGEDTPEPPRLAMTPSLSPYVQARLGRPRSKIGLRSTSRSSTPANRLELSTDTRSDSGPGHNNLQGSGPRTSHMSTTKIPSQDVPALIPGAAPTKFEPESDERGVTESRRSSHGRGGKGSREVSPERRHEVEEPSSTPSFSLAPVQVWADAQTELEARFDPRDLPEILSPLPLSPPLSTEDIDDEDGKSNIEEGDTVETTRTVRASSTSRHLHSGVAIGRPPQRTLSVMSKASSARSTLLDRPDGVPAPAAYVVRQMEEMEGHRLEEEMEDGKGH